MRPSRRRPATPGCKYDNDCNQGQHKGQYHNHAVELKPHVKVGNFILWKSRSEDTSNKQPKYGSFIQHAVQCDKKVITQMVLRSPMQRTS